MDKEQTAIMRLQEASKMSLQICWKPIGKITEMPEFIIEGEEEDSFAPLTFTGNETMTFTFKPKWRSRIKTWWMLTGRWPLKRLFCKHHWVMAHEVNKYIDASGYTVSVWRCYCPKCGKWKNRRYSRWTKPRN